MIKVERFVCNMIQENCYVVSDETKEAVIIDCGAFYDEERKTIVDYITANSLTPKHLIATHGHFDHNFGNNTIFDHFGLKVELSGDDKDLIENVPAQAQAICGVQINYDMPPVGRFFNGNDTISFGSHTFTILETPGHTMGSVVFYCEKEHLAFTGDTLFRRSIGRTDLPGGSMFSIIQSLRAIAQLPDHTLILPGHGAQTNVGDEIAHNPYMDR